MGERYRLCGKQMKCATQHLFTAALGSLKFLYRALSFCPPPFHAGVYSARRGTGSPGSVSAGD